MGCETFSSMPSGARPHITLVFPFESSLSEEELAAGRSREVYEKRALTLSPGINDFAFMRNRKSSEILSPLKALASPVRLEILAYLKKPVENFPPQVEGDLIKDGVCADFIREKLRIAPATASRHLTLLTDAGLLLATRKKGWTFYRRDESAILRLTKRLEALV